MFLIYRVELKVDRIVFSGVELYGFLIYRVELKVASPPLKFS